MGESFNAGRFPQAENLPGRKQHTDNVVEDRRPLLKRTEC